MFIIDLHQYGLEESIGLHIILSNTLWWLSLVLAAIAYRKRHIWNVGSMPWTFLFLTFIFFGIRELGHFSKSPFIASIRYIFGMWSAIFMTAALFSLFLIICHRKKISRTMYYSPFALALVFLVIWSYLYLSGNAGLKSIIGTLENFVWIFGSLITIYTTYMLGTRVTGGFIKVFMFFQFAAYFALTWKLLGLIESTGCTFPYSIREIFESLFGIFAILSMYVLTGMLRKLAKKLS